MSDFREFWGKHKFPDRHFVNMERAWNACAAEKDLIIVRCATTEKQLRRVMQMALDALETIKQGSLMQTAYSGMSWQQCALLTEKPITALRTALGDTTHG